MSGSYDLFQHNTSDVKRVGFLHQAILEFTIDTNWVSYDFINSDTA